MKRIFLVPLVILLVCAFVFAGCTQPAPAPAPVPAPAPAPTPTPAPAPAPKTKTYELDYISFISLNNIEYKMWKEPFVDKLHEKANGELEIKIHGGPEVMHVLDMAPAVAKGVIDMCMAPTGYFDSLVPGCDLTRLSTLTEAEERATGAYDYIRSLYAKANLHYLGRIKATKQEGDFYLFTNKKVAKPEDFKGLKLGGSRSFLDHYEAMGATPVTISMPEYFPSLERGVVDGATTTLYMMYGSGMYEVIDYTIDHPFYKNTVAVVVNLDTWNRLPKHLQDLMMECQIELERDTPPLVDELCNEYKDKMKAAGIEFIEFSPEVEEWYYDCAIRGAWEADAVKRYPADVVAKLREMLTKG